MRKYSSLLLIVLAFTFFSSDAHAGLLDELRKGNLNLDQASNQLSTQAKVPKLDAENLLKTLKDSSNLSTLSGDKLLEGLKTGKIDGLNGIKDITDMVEQFDINKIEEKVVDQVLDSISLGKLSPDLGKALSKIKDLGKLDSLADIEKLFSDPDILKGLDKIFDATGLKTQVQQAIDQITKLAAVKDLVKSLGENLVADAIANILEKFAPDLLKALGGLFDFSKILSDVFSGGIIAGSVGSGKYEIFPPEPHSSAAPGSCSNTCFLCTCQSVIEQNHVDIRKHTTEEFIKHRTWVIDELFTVHILPAMALMTSQLNTVAVQHTKIIGTFFDAKHQLETQRLFQQLMAEAHKDYQPSEGMCDIGTNVRSLMSSEQKSKLAHHSLAKYGLDRQLRNADMASGSGDNVDIKSRIQTFVKNHCDKRDNSNGLNFLCKNGGGKPARQNKDINFMNTVENELTLNVDFSDSKTADLTPDEKDIFALSANLFAHKVLPGIPGDQLVSTETGQPRALAYRYLDQRSIAAKRSVAQDAFSAIIAERTTGNSEISEYLKSVILELGVPKKDIDTILGKNPSYFAQMEILTKKLYQNPTFYTELYDKPANVTRKHASLQAIRLMQERDFYHSQIRSEVVLATLLEVMLQDEFRRVKAQLQNIESEKE